MPTFYCNNENCERFQQEEFQASVRYTHTSSGLVPDIAGCIKCGRPLTEVKMTGTGMPTIGKWKNKSSAEKKKILMKESSEHFQKHIKPRSIEMLKQGKHTSGE